MINRAMYTLIAAAPPAPGEIDFRPLPNNAQADAAQSMLPNVLSILFGTLGAVALLIIVIAGFRYVIAAGDPAKMSQAKKAILYALIGLAIALSGFSIVTFVVKGVV